MRLRGRFPLQRTRGTFKGGGRGCKRIQNRYIQIKKEMDKIGTRDRSPRSNSRLDSHPAMAMEFAQSDLTTWKCMIVIDRFTLPVPINYQKQIARWLYEIVGLDDSYALNWANINSPKPYHIDTNAYQIHFQRGGRIYLKGFGKDNFDKLKAWINEYDCISFLGMNINRESTLSSMRETFTGEMDTYFPWETDNLTRQLWGTTSPVCVTKETETGPVYLFPEYGFGYFDALTSQAHEVLEWLGIDSTGFNIMQTSHGEVKRKGIFFGDEILKCNLMAFEVQGTPKQIHFIEHWGIGDFAWTGFGCVKRIYVG